ncbi:Holliday junction resolvase RuvX [bacterium]|jgi:putative Holliday junction resolvase|nr:Holliday junction resolvase RuvX [bacterium]MDP6571466.1 Holliday junction resolvase RuvX [Patescibacteria group bacterium]MDP6756208.1 Holliday junction resolvase RuvX [Patescibacteria group bacterium]|tara:strand:+ start:1523 stop:1879 length:357 start_codon:yes stop_codon:yes gene_type:complete
MNYLGIDYGKSKIGLAIAKDGVKVATPFSVVNSIDEVKSVVSKELIDEIVVGYPLSLSGKQGSQAREVDAFIKQLESLAKPIHKQDERFSTRSAAHNKEDDASSACIILQTYLERKNT